MELHGSPASGDAFADRRRTGIGGSDAAAVLGVSPWESPLSVWEEKRGLRPPETSVPERFVWGQRLEGAILAEYAEREGIRIRRGGRRFLRHPGLAFVVGHPDALAEDRLVEAKTAAFLDERWGEEGSADVPLHYYVQLQHYMILTGKTRADLAVLVGGRELRTYRIPADPVFQDALVAEERDLWRRVIEDDPPAPDGSESAGRALRSMFPRAFPEEIVATPAIAEVAERYERASSESKRWGAIAEESKQHLQAFMGARTKLVGDGWSASWPNVSGSVSWKLVAKAYRDLLERAAKAEDDASADYPEIDSILRGEYGLPLAEWLETIEGLHRGEDSRRFTFTRKGAPEE